MLFFWYRRWLNRGKPPQETNQNCVSELYVNSWQFSAQTLSLSLSLTLSLPYLPYLHLSHSLSSLLPLSLSLCHTHTHTHTHTLSPSLSLTHTHTYTFSLSLSLSLSSISLPTSQNCALIPCALSTYPFLRQKLQREEKVCTIFFTLPWEASSPSFRTLTSNLSLRPHRRSDGFFTFSHHSFNLLDN